MKVYPYPHLQEGVRLFVPQGILLPLHTALASAEIDQDRFIVRLCERDIKTHPRVKLISEVFASRSEIDRFCMQDERIVTATLIAHCRLTHLRAAVPLRPASDNPALWQGEIELDRRNLRGTVSLRAVLTSVHSGGPHRLLAASDPWTIIADDTPALGVSGDFAPSVRWLNFRDADTFPHLQREAEQPYYVDLYGDLPVICLNAGFPGLRELFPHDKKPEGLLLPLHEALSMGISRSAWQAMFQASLCAASMLTETEGEATYPSGWQGMVLHYLLPRVYPGLNSMQALRQALQDMRGEGAASLQSRLLSGINILIGDGKALRRAISALNELNEIALDT